MDIITKDRLCRDLLTLGLRAGDAVYVHTSMKAIGWVEGGADALIDAFLDVLGEAGTLAVPTHTYSFAGLGVPPYDPATTQSELGAFPNAVWRHPRALRSGHGSHSSAAIGAQASFLTRDHDPAHALGPASPLYRLWERGGKVLLLGVGHTANTMIHLAESLARVPYLTAHYDASWGADVLRIGEDGAAEAHRQTEFPGCSGYFEQIQPLLEAQGLVRSGLVGRAPSRLMAAQDLVRVTRELLAREPGALLCDKPGCPCCPARKGML